MRRFLVTSRGRYIFAREYRLFVLDAAVRAASRYTVFGRLDAVPIGMDPERDAALGFTAVGIGPCVRSGGFHFHRDGSCDEARVVFGHPLARSGVLLSETLARRQAAHAALADVASSWRRSGRWSVPPDSPRFDGYANLVVSEC